MSVKTKHDILDEAEMRDVRVPEPFRTRLLEHAARSGRDPRTLRILEWGCGRGALVAALLAEGFDAIGIDVDPLPLDNGRGLLRGRGYDPEARLLRWDPAGRVPLGDRSFDVILSDQVIEHIDAIDAAAAEMSRLLAPGGFGLHVFPAHRCIVEPHLHMPFVHWLPKNGLRLSWIRVMVALGVEPHWSELAGSERAIAARTYFEYSVARTHYRSPDELRRTMRRHGLDAEFWGSGGRSRVLQLALGAAKRISALRPLLSSWQRTWHSTWMRTVPLADGGAG